MNFEQMLAAYGPPYTWDDYTWFINKWRLLGEEIEIRVLLDVALRCPIPELKVKAAEKFGDTAIARLDHDWPGQWAFEYNWEGLAKMYKEKVK